MTTTSDGNVMWKHIGLHGHSVGTFTCNESGITWKSALLGQDADDAVGVGGTTRHIPTDSMSGKIAKWTVFGRSGHLRVVSKTTSGGSNKGDSSSSDALKHEYRFDGFPNNDFDVLRSTLKEKANVELQKHNMSAAGTQYGLCKVSNRNLVFRHCILEDADEEGEEYEPREGDEMMSLDLAEVSQCVLPGNNRNEIELQFPESDTVEAGTDQLVAIRFYIPPDPDVDPNDKTIPFPAEVLQQKIMQTANIRKTTGDVIVEFEQNKGTFLTPRGRYAIELYDWFLRMRGQKYDYKIRYDDINRLFLLPKPDEVHMAFVIALDKPIRQGQQRYQYLVLQATKEADEVTVNLDEETLKKEYGGELQPIMRGSLSNLVAKTFKVIARKKVFIPGKFANANQQACVKCALRANEGLLYPLEKQFVFIHKPPVLIRFNEVESVEFQRYAGGQGSTRNFDLCVNLKHSEAIAAGGPKEYTFSGIDRSDYAGLYNFLSGKKIVIRNLQDDLGAQEQVVKQKAAPVYNEDVIYGVTAGPGEEDSSEDESYGENDAQKDDEPSSDGSLNSVDDDDFGSEIDEDNDSDLEEARKRSGKPSQPKPDAVPKKKKPKEPAEAAATKSKKRRPPPKKESSKHKDDDSEDDEDNTRSSPPAKKQKKTTKSKDPNAPKKNMSAYMLYSNSVRKQIQNDNPDFKFGEITKKIAEDWKNLDETSKEKWTDRAAKDKRRYEAEMNEYSAPSDMSSDDGAAAAKKKKKKDPNAPKKAISAYMYYMSKNRERIKEANPSATFGELAKLIGAEFRNLGSDEKSKYEKMAEEDKIRYQNEMENYTPPVASSSSKGGGSSSGKAAGGKKVVKKDPDAPKRALTSFMFFSKENRAKVKSENPGVSFGELGKILGVKFKELTDDEKRPYEKMAQADKERYKKLLSEYKQKQIAAKRASSSDDSGGGSDNDDDDDDDDDSDDDDGSGSGSGTESEDDDDDDSDES